jgi:hypothetical protein
MYALTWRELVSFWRAPAFWAAAIVHVSLLFSFVLVWGDGLPLVNGGTNWQQFNTAQFAILSVLFPWIAARCSPLQSHDLVILSLVTATSPSRLLLARWLAAWVALLGVIVIALPVTLLMQQIAVTPFMSVAARLGVNVALAAVAAAITTGCMAIFDRTLNGWVAATTATFAAGLLMPASPTTASLWLLACAGAAMAGSTLAVSRCVYLPQDAAA